MANEHAVPEEKSEKVHGDKLDGVLEKVNGGHGAAAPKAMPESDDDGDGGGDGLVPSSDGKTMP